VELAAAEVVVSLVGDAGLDNVEFSLREHLLLDPGRTVVDFRRM
jgi:hypothetical protein